MGDTKHKGLYLRVVSALILAPLVLFALIYGGWPFAVLAGLAIGLSSYEWAKMAKLSKHPFLHTFLGLIYIFACLAALIYLRLSFPNGAGITLALLLSVWASDSGAYFTGKAIGGPKMAPSISPNKTWAGLIGGMVSSAAVFTLYVLYIGPWLRNMTGWDLTAISAPIDLLLAIGALITISGQAGDLLISKEKRTVGVKDTGNIIPGHGGILDRIDALLLAGLVFLICIEVLGL